MQTLGFEVWWTLYRVHLCGRMGRHSFRAADVASTSPRYELGKVFLVACFSSVKNHNVSGLIFFQVSPHTPKNPFATPRSVLQRTKKSIYNRSQFRTLFLPHRFIKIRPSHLLICWPINLSNRFSGFLRLDRLHRFGKISKSIFAKFWKREIQFFSDFQNFFGFWKFRGKCCFGIVSKFPVGMACVVVAYSLTSTDVDREFLGSKPTKVIRNFV